MEAIYLLADRERLLVVIGAPHTSSLSRGRACPVSSDLNMGNYGQLWWQVISSEKLHSDLLAALTDMGLPTVGQATGGRWMDGMMSK